MPARPAKRTALRVLLVCGSALLTLLVLEVLLRLVFALPLPGPATRLAGYLGDARTGDTKQRLLLRLSAAHATTPPLFDPELGWTAAPKTPANPFGFLTHLDYTQPENAPGGGYFLFLGDSFVEGYTEEPEKLSSLLGRELGVPVINAGVRGYGVDQMYLLLRSTAGRIELGHVLVGVLYADIDRLLFRVNQGPKPYFEVDHGALVQRGTPISPDPQEWLARYPPRVGSYVAAAAAGAWRRVAATRWVTERFFFLHPSQTSGRRERKQELCRLLVRAIRQECAGRNLPLTFVLFPHAYHLAAEGWEERFMHQLLREEGIDSVDMAVPLDGYLRREGRLWWRDLYPLEAHPDARENEVMARRLAQHLRQRSQPPGPGR